MSKPVVSEDTYIRKLNFSVIQKIVTMLEPDQLWKKFIVHIPKTLHSSDFVERYSDQQVKMIEEKGRKRGSSSTRVILDDWGTQNAQVKHLLKALKASQLYAAADYISVDVLKKGKVPRDGNINDVNVVNTLNSVSISPGTCDNMENDSRKKDMYDKQIFPDTISSSASSSDSHQNLKSVTNGFCSPDSTMSQCSASRNEVLYDRIPSYDSGAPSQELRSPPEMEQLTTKTEEVNVSAIFRPGSTAIKYSVLRDHTNNFCNRKVSEGGNVVGCGGFGTVYLAVFSGNYKMAVKKLKDTNDPIMLKQFETELKTLTEYKHENIVELLGYSIDGPEKCLVYEFMPNGSLEDRLHCLNGTEPLSWQLRLDIAYGTAKGIAYLNNEGLVHRDVKSANVLLDERYVPKVGDFATARLAPSGCGSTVMNTTLVIGTSAYMAPEAIRFDISSKLDSFAFGVVLLEILTGLPPNDPNRSEQDLLSFVAENCDDEIVDLLDKNAGPWCRDTADKIYQIAMQCTETHKKKRATVTDILQPLQEILPRP